MLATVNGGPSKERSCGARGLIIIGAKLHGNGVHLSLQTRRWPMAYGRQLSGMSVFLFLLIFCFTSTQLSDGFF